MSETIAGALGQIVGTMLGVFLALRVVSWWYDR